MQCPKNILQAPPIPCRSCRRLRSFALEKTTSKDRSLRQLLHKLGSFTRDAQAGGFQQFLGVGMLRRSKYLRDAPCSTTWPSLITSKS